MKEEMNLGELFGYVSRLHHQKIREYLRGVELYRGQPPLLFLLHKEDGLAKTEISEKLSITPATVSRMVTRMGKAGFIYTEKSDTDSRVSRVYLADKGKEIIEEVEEMMWEINKASFESFTEEEKIVFKKLLLKMMENLVKK